MTADQRDQDDSFSTAATREAVKQVEADLLDEGIGLFPNTQGGVHAHLLWHRISEPLFRGAGVQIAISVLGLGWHRQELKRARDILVKMELIRPRPDGLHELGRYDSLDEEVRERFVELRAIEKVMTSFGDIMRKSKTHRKPRPDARHK